MTDWEAYQNHVFYSRVTGLMLDYYDMGMTEEFFSEVSPKLKAALAGMAQLDAGAIANPDEGRMVGHYWLRNPALAPTAALQQEIEDCLYQLKDFVSKVHTGALRSGTGKQFRNVLVAGVGGSSLGPHFVSQALGTLQDFMKLYYMDNTDPRGIEDTLAAVEPELDQTLAVIISKSGGTVETRNCMEEIKAFYRSHGLNFPNYAVCITHSMESKLFRTARQEGWIESFPMWDWVGGRTSVTSAVGLLPLALQGIDIDNFLRGARECDNLNRNPDPRQNPAALLAAAWYRKSGGKGGESMVVLPYRDRLSLLAKYLQQLVMESLGKELDLDGNKVNQGLAVFGSKGSTDQHSYLQQLIEGPGNVFVVFVQVRKDRYHPPVIVGEGSTSGDYLNAAMLGTQKALWEHGRCGLTITLQETDAYSLGLLIALFERAVGIYALMIHVNAYHQPAVESGKKATRGLIDLKNRARQLLRETGSAMTAQELAERLDADPADVFKILYHLSFNYPTVIMEEADPIFQSRFRGKTE